MPSISFAPMKSCISRRDMTIGEVARKLGISRQALSMKIHGHTRMSVEELYKISTFLEADITDLIEAQNFL